jgi:DNA-binding CsgD family transcriptional regulator
MADWNDFPVQSPPGDAASRVAALSPRCRDVLDGIMAGHSRKVIAGQLGISPRTVEIHRAHLNRRLGARNIADALRVAYEARYVRELPHRGGEPQRPENGPLGVLVEPSHEQGVLFPLPQAGIPALARSGGRADFKSLRLL